MIHEIKTYHMESEDDHYAQQPDDPTQRTDEPRLGPSIRKTEAWRLLAEEDARKLHEAPHVSLWPDQRKEGCNLQEVTDVQRLVKHTQMNHGQIQTAPRSNRSVGQRIIDTEQRILGIQFSRTVRWWGARTDRMLDYGLGLLNSEREKAMNDSIRRMFDDIAKSFGK